MTPLHSNVQDFWSWLYRHGGEPWGPAGRRMDLGRKIFTAPISESWQVVKVTAGAVALSLLSNATTHNKWGREGKVVWCGNGLKNSHRWFSSRFLPAHHCLSFHFSLSQNTRTQPLFKPRIIHGHIFSTATLSACHHPKIIPMRVNSSHKNWYAYQLDHRTV